MLMHLEDTLVRMEIYAYEYSAESFGLAPAGRVNSVKPVKLHFKPSCYSVLLICATCFSIKRFAHGVLHV
jgi:hypothetical protein